MSLSNFVAPKNFRIFIDGDPMGYAVNRRKAHKLARKWAREYGISGPVTVIQIRDPGHTRLYHSH